MKNKTKTALTGLSLLATTLVSQSAVISFAGSQLNLGDGWRTPSVAKTFDADGNNIYGTDGYLMFQTGFTGTTFRFDTDPFSNASSALPGYVTVTNDGSTGSVTAAAYTDIDNPATAPANFKSGTASRGNITLGSEVSMFNLNFNGTAPAAGVRVGVFVNNAPDRNAAAVRLTLDGSPLVTASSATGPGVGSQNDYYFFDITNIAAGDTFSFFATEDIADGNTGGEVRIGGYTFDTIPEPATTGLFALAGFAALLRRKRA